MSTLANHPTQVVRLPPAPAEPPLTAEAFRSELIQTARHHTGHELAALRRRPSWDRFGDPDRFSSRFALARYVYGLNRAAEGTIGSLGGKKLENDLVDLRLATHATFYDGLLSFDKRAVGLYRQLTAILKSNEKN